MLVYIDMASAVNIFAPGGSLPRAHMSDSALYKSLRHVLKLNNEMENVQTTKEQEGDTQDTLDASLSIHARQLSKKQARESELEWTIADLGAALPCRGPSTQT
eukprot:scaffold232839_cov24-Attheya_sp.AAC.1